jgi:hypothetical protein
MGETFFSIATFEGRGYMYMDGGKGIVLRMRGGFSYQTYSNVVVGEMEGCAAHDVAGQET